jgi:hypothetical protein
MKALGEIDLFDRSQLAEVVQVCRNSRSMSEAGRRLFGASRIRKTSSNDADRLRKYLNRFGIEWDQIIQLGAWFDSRLCTGTTRFSHTIIDFTEPRRNLRLHHDQTNPCGDLPQLGRRRLDARSRLSFQPTLNG